VLALLAGGVAVYFALSLAGWVPPPERLLAGMSRRWGRAMRASVARKGTLFQLGLLWGLLPCGLVLAGLLIAAGGGSATTSGASSWAPRPAATRCHRPNRFE
jgi:sulfite exporter TauE/SafE